MNKRSKFLTTFAVLLFVIAIFRISSYATMNEQEQNDTFESATQLGNYDKNIVGKLDSEVDEDYFIYTPLYTGPYEIVIQSGNSATKTLYNSSREIIDETPNNTLRAELTENCNYYIKLKCNSTYDMSKADYTISIIPLKHTRITQTEVEYNNSFLSANILPNNTKTVSISGAINQPADADYYMFTPKISGTYTIKTTGSTDTVGYLYDNNGIGNGIMRPESKQYLATNDDYYDNNFSITYNLSAFTTYYIKVTHHISYANRGDYNLVISIPQETISYDIEGNSISSAYVLSAGIPYTAQINSPTDVDYFRFTATETAYYRIETKSFNNTTGQIYSGSGQLLASDTDTAENFVLEMKLQKNIAYYIKVTDINGSTGNYTICVTRGKTLPLVNQTQQPYSYLCWATSASMIISYINNDEINRTVEIAKHLYPNTYSYEFNLRNDMDTISKSIERYITGYSARRITPKKFSSVFGAYPFNDIVKAIDMNSPIVFLIDGHCVVGKGYMYQRDGVTGPFLIYNDPWDGQEHAIDFNEFLFYESLCYIPTPAANGEKEVNDTVFSADIIHINDEKVASIGNEGDVDWYMIGTYPGNYTVETFGMTDTYGEVYMGSIPIQDPHVANRSEVWYSDFVLIGQDNNSGTNGNFKINFTTDTSYRTYYVKVKHSSPYVTGNYTIKVTRN